MGTKEIRCVNCGESLFSWELFCNYCGQQNIDFDLDNFNEIIVTAIGGDYFKSAEDIENFCTGLAGGEPHDYFIKRARRALKIPRSEPMLYCENCGKKLLDFISGKLIKIE